MSEVIPKEEVEEAPPKPTTPPQVRLSDLTRKWIRARKAAAELDAVAVELKHALMQLPADTSVTTFDDEVVWLENGELRMHKTVSAYETYVDTFKAAIAEATNGRR